MSATLALLLVVVGVSVGGASVTTARADREEHRMSPAKTLSLSTPVREGSVSLERALQDRRTRRVFDAKPLTLADVAQLLWAMQGTTAPDGGRTAPSAGALYPLEVYVAVGDAQGIAEGIYRYVSAGHELVAVAAGDVREMLAAAALGQQWVAQAAIIFIIGAVEARTTAKYGPRGVRFVHIEVGHTAQNALLQAEALGLNAGVVGAFDGDLVAQALNLPADTQPIYLIPIGPR